MTITYQEINRMPLKNGGVDITVKFSDSKTGQEIVKTMYFNRAKPSLAQITNRCSQNAINYEFELINAMNEIEIEVEIAKLVDYIHANPTVTYSKIVAAIEVYPDFNKTS
uniref:Uncharacterized protein n=1 Tax=viral metagenome TaxID=1070528 RepID=A0A6M3LF80_9ZZZZ